MMSALIVASATDNVLYGRAFDATGGYHAALAWSTDAPWHVPPCRSRRSVTAAA